MKNLIIAIHIITLISCTSQSEILTDNGKIIDGIFYCDKFDWNIEIPEGYTITSSQEKEDLEQIGYDAIKTEVPEGFAVRENRPHLIGFGIDEFNYFSSSLEPFGSTNMSMEEHQKFVSDLLKKTYKELKGISIEQELSTENIGKRKFYNIKTKLFDEETEELIMAQVIFNTKVDSHLFSSSINFNSEDVFETLYKNFKKSLDKNAG